MRSFLRTLIVYVKGRAEADAVGRADTSQADLLPRPTRNRLAARARVRQPR